MIAPNDEPPSDDLQLPGGQGGPASIVYSSGQTSDTRLIERAIRERWPIPEKYRAPLIDRQIRISIDPASSPRESTSAFKAVLAAEAQNQADSHKQTPDVHLHAHEHSVNVEQKRSELLSILSALKARAEDGP